MISKKQIFILIAGAFVCLILIFFTLKGAPLANAANKEISYHEWGYFRADNGVKGGPGCGIRLQHNEDIGRGRTRYREGIQGFFTTDSACKRAYGPGMVAGTDLGKYENSISMCGIDSNRFHRVECIIPASSPCAEWKNGACIKSPTSLYQGGNNTIGDISTEPALFIVRIFTIILGFAGGIALLLIIRAGYKVMTSKGNPEAVQQSRDQLISAIIGLLFIIFSFVIFQLVAVDIFKIPGFN